MTTGVESSKQRLHRLLDNQITWYAVWRLTNHKMSDWINQFVLTPAVLEVVGTKPRWLNYGPSVLAADITLFSGLATVIQPRLIRGVSEVVVHSLASTLARAVAALARSAGGAAARATAAHASTAWLLAVPGVGWFLNGAVLVLDAAMFAELVWSTVNLRSDLIDGLTEDLIGYAGS